MDEQFIKKLSQKTEQIRDLKSIKYKTPKEKEELDQGVKDLDQLLNQLKDQQQLDQLAMLIDYCINYPERDQKTLEQMYTELDWKEKHMTWLEWRQKQRDVLQEENELKLQLDILERQENNDKMKEKIKEISREQQYVTTKKDKDGLYQIKEDKYKEKLKALRLKYQDAQGKREKLSALGNLFNHKMIKSTKLFNNGMIRTAKGIRTVSKSINVIGESLDEISSYSGYTKPKRTSGTTKSKSKKKGKKSKSRPNKDYNENYGFNSKEVFDI